MLDKIFLTVVKMSITASIVAIIVILLRQLIGRKLPRTFSYALWAIVLIRLLIPFSIQSDFSLFNIMKSPVNAIDSAIENAKLLERSTSQEVVPVENKVRDNTGNINNQQDRADKKNIENNDNVLISNHEAKTLKDKVSFSGKTEPVFIMSCIWISVFLILLAFCIYAYLKIIGRFKTAVLFSDNGLLAESLNKLKLKRKVNIYITDGIDTPVVSGIANVRIIIPAFLTDDCYKKELQYVITHELVHIKRYDNITKLLAILSLCIHWFNPLIWLCFLIYQKDMEMSCDARVLTAYENDIRTEYANSLLNIAVKQNSMYGLVLAFGENNLKGRIKGIMKFKKNKVWLGIFAALLLVVLAFILLTNGQNDNFDNINSAVINYDTLDNLLEHRSRYIGDASNVGNLLDKLPYGKVKEGIELDTDSKPYGITINYRLEDIDASNQDAIKNVEPTLLDNALILFSLIENVDIVRFKILPSDTVVQFERTQLQQFFDKDLWEYSSTRKDFQEFLLDIYFEIFIFPEKYSLAISAVPGMRILIALNAEYYDSAYSVKYSTESGSLITKNVTTREITDHGKSVNFTTLASAEPVYWLPIEMDETVRENIVTISVLNKKGDIIISKRIKIEKENDRFYTVKPSYDISYDTM